MAEATGQAQRVQTVDAARAALGLAFVRRCGKFSPWRAVTFGIRLLWLRVVELPCWLEALRRHAHDTNRACLLPDDGDQTVLAECGALAWQVAALSHGTPAPMDTGLLYGHIALADRWVDVSAHDADARRELAQVIIGMALGEVRQSQSRDRSTARVFDQLELGLSLVHARNCIQPGWPRLDAALRTLLAAGYHEFEAHDVPSALKAAEAVGEASALVLLQVAHLAGDGPSPQDERTARKLGAILNVLDDLLDWPEDLRSRTCTVVTAARSVEEGEAVGYARCDELYTEMASAASTGQLADVRNVIATWWLRMAFKRRTVAPRTLWQLVWA